MAMDRSKEPVNFLAGFFLCCVCLCCCCGIALLLLLGYVVGSTKTTVVEIRPETREKVTTKGVAIIRANEKSKHIKKREAAWNANDTPSKPRLSIISKTAILINFAPPRTVRQNEINGYNVEVLNFNDTKWKLVKTTKSGKTQIEIANVPVIDGQRFRVSARIGAHTSEPSVASERLAISKVRTPSRIVNFKITNFNESTIEFCFGDPVTSGGNAILNYNIKLNSNKHLILKTKQGRIRNLVNGSKNRISYSALNFKGESEVDVSNTIILHKAHSAPRKLGSPKLDVTNKQNLKVTFNFLPPFNATEQIDCIDVRVIQKKNEKIVASFSTAGTFQYFQFSHLLLKENIDYKVITRTRNLNGTSGWSASKPFSMPPNNYSQGMLHDEFFKWRQIYQNNVPENSVYLNHENSSALCRDEYEIGKFDKKSGKCLVSSGKKGNHFNKVFIEVLKPVVHYWWKKVPSTGSIPEAVFQFLPNFKENAALNCVFGYLIGRTYVNKHWIPCKFLLIKVKSINCQKFDFTQCYWDTSSTNFASWGGSKHFELLLIQY